MNRIASILVAFVGLAFAVPKASGDTIPAGTIIRVRTNQTIDANSAAHAGAFAAVVAENVSGRSGQVVFPRGARAELVVMAVSKHEVALTLNSITTGGRTYALATSGENIHGGHK